MKEALKKAIIACAEKASKSESSCDDAARYTQAALNAAQALATIEIIKD